MGMVYSGSEAAKPGSAVPGCQPIVARKSTHAIFRFRHSPTTAVPTTLTEPPTGTMMPPGLPLTIGDCGGTDWSNQPGGVFTGAPGRSATRSIHTIFLNSEK